MSESQFRHRALVQGMRRAAQLAAREWVAEHVREPISREDARTLKSYCEGDLGRHITHEHFVELLAERGLLL